MSMTTKTVICPTDPGPENSNILGCGQTVENQPDDEGFVDCPACGVFWKPENETVMPVS